MSVEPWQWALAALAACLIGLSKTGITGLGIFAVVIFASLLPARESVGVVLAILLVGDIVAIIMYRREAHWGYLLRIFPWAAIGVVVGAVLTGFMPDSVMRVLIGVIVIVLSIMQTVRSLRPSTEQSQPLPGWMNSAAGLFAGFTTMVANAAGPLMVVYLLAQGLPKLVFVGTTAWFFLALNLFKVPFSYGLGLISAGSLGISMSLAPFVILGALFGRPLLSRINQRTFELIALGLSLVAGFRLVFT